jgi:F-box/leucine-rich repeat protein 2/20
VSLLEAFGGTLRDLNLSKCKKLTNMSIFAIREHCHSLHTLDISEMNKISTAALLGLFLPPEIEADAAVERESDYCESVVFNSEKKFSSGIGSLQSVILRGNSGTSDEVVIQLAETANVSLLRLDVCNCWCLSNKALISIATNCSSLQTLDVSFCSDMDDLGLKFLAKQLQATLDSLSIWGCVTTLVGPHIIGSLPKSL